MGDGGRGWGDGGGGDGLEIQYQQRAAAHLSFVHAPKTNKLINNNKAETSNE